MQKNTLNFIVDLLATVAMLVLIATGLLVYFILVPGSRGGHGLEFWGMSRHEWGDIHFYTSLALIGLMLLHVILHWDWVCLTVYRWVNPQGFREKRMTLGKQTAYGVGFLVVVTALVAGFLGLAATGVTRGEEDDDHGGRGRSQAALLADTDPGEGSGRRHRGGRGNVEAGRTSPQVGAVEAPAAAQPGEPPRHADEADHEAHDAGLRGSSTLAEAAAEVGVAVDVLRAALGLSPETPDTTRLGQIRRELGISMSSLREQIEALRDREP